MKNYYRRWIPVALGVVICLQVATADAGERCCQRCGCSDGVKMICRPVCTTKYIEVTCWDCVSDVMCVPKKHDCNCDDSSCANCKIRPVNKLVRKTTLQPVQVVVWVVDYICPNCRQNGETDSLPMPPAVPETVSRSYPETKAPMPELREVAPTPVETIEPTVAPLPSSTKGPTIDPIASSRKQSPYRGNILPANYNEPSVSPVVRLNSPALNQPALNPPVNNPSASPRW